MRQVGTGDEQGRSSLQRHRQGLPQRLSHDEALILDHHRQQAKLAQDVLQKRQFDFQRMFGLVM
jgi:hypothetical protein